ncbi:MAG: HAD-IIB family hydrolase [Clostridiales bacterium]|nr:HAD-IIB family hydrolase [Clostridiales bacterium]
MKPLKEFSQEQIHKIKYILTDIDDTMTTEGKLGEEAYSAMWHAYKVGYWIIPVTGRPAGWCDLMIRQWPIKAIVGENGAFVYYFEDGQLKTFTHPSVAEQEIRHRLETIKEAVLQAIPQCRIAKDQFSRKYDLAIDFNEDPPYLGFEVANQIKQICEDMGAEAKVSSIHVNTWFGDYDKVSMTRLFLEEILYEKDIQEKSIFFGDSPNDEPMFAYFPNSCAVANINIFLPQLKTYPAFITDQKGGKGFAEAIEYLISMTESTRR